MRTANAVILAVILLATSAAAQDEPAFEFKRMSDWLRSVAVKVNPTVVQIFTATYGPVDQNPATGFTFDAQRGSGSGVIVDPAGYIMTNNHVVEGARRVQVLLSPSLRDEPAGASNVSRPGMLVGARVVGVDRETDLALLKVNLDRELPFLRLGDSDALFQGQIVFAFGSPLGLTNSVSMGVVSALARQLEQESRMIYIQTDAAVNPGNSGGPLVNARGEVVGINTLIFSQSGGYEGLSFAAPSNIVRTVFEQLRAYGRVQRGTIAVHAETITPWLARGLGLTRDFGVILADVYPGGPGEKAGLRVGDIVLKLNGKPMENARQFHVNIYSKGIGRKVAVEVMRAGKHRTLEVEVVERAERDQQLFDMVTPENNRLDRLGIMALDLDRQTSAMFPRLRGSRGVVVASVFAQSAVLGEPFRPGDVIYALNNQPLGGLSDLKLALEALAYGSVVVFQVEREGQLQFLTMQLD